MISNNSIAIFGTFLLLATGLTSAATFELEASHIPETPSTDQEVTVSASTSGTEVESIEIFLDGNSQGACETDPPATTSCTRYVGTLSEGSHTYQATATLEGESTETDINFFNITSDGSDSGDSPCEEDIDALEETEFDSLSTQQIQEMQCPHSSDFTYTARNGNEISFLSDKGWTEVNESEDLELEAEHFPERPSAEDEVTIVASTSETVVGSIAIFVDGEQKTECEGAGSAVSSCKYSAEPLSDGTHTYQATASIPNGTGTETDINFFNVTSEDSDPVGAEECREDIDALEETEFDSLSTQQIQEMQCPEYSNITYTARNGNEISFLSERGWTEVDGGGGDPPGTPGDDPTEYEIELGAGWNMLSAPTSSSKNQVPMNAITDDCSIVETVNGNHAYGFPNTNGAYSQTDTLSAMKGYWVEAQESCTATFTSEDMSEGSLSMDIAAGWNLISVENEASIADIIGECNFVSEDAKIAYRWQPSAGEYETLSRSTSMSPLNGYWVEAESSCNLGS